MANLSIPDDLLEQLQHLAQEEKRPIEELLASMVEIYIYRRKKLLAMSGMFDDDVTDLSTTVRETITQFYQGKDDHTR